MILLFYFLSLFNPFLFKNRFFKYPTDYQVFTKQAENPSKCTKILLCEHNKMLKKFILNKSGYTLTDVQNS